jgi:hypothetical protein
MARRRLWSPYFDQSFFDAALEERKRNIEKAEAEGRIIPFNVLDAMAEGIDARVSTDRGRGTWNARGRGSLSRMYCVSCHKPSPYAVLDQMYGVWFKCDDCCRKYGVPQGARAVMDDNGKAITGGGGK